MKPQRTQYMSLDTETTGVDFQHGAKPFFVTTCNEQGEQTYWDWEVDPLTREPQIPECDLKALAQHIGEFLASGGYLVFQNPKFDLHALETIGLWDLLPLKEVWPDVRDTLLAGHLLASSRPHNLTAMALQYLNVDIQPFEDVLHKSCVAARRIARKEFPFLANTDGSTTGWTIAKEGLDCMPSAGDNPSKTAKGAESESTWKMDCWLPRLVAGTFGYPDPDDYPDCSHEFGSDWICRECGGHGWHIFLREYANADSAVTLPIYLKQLELLQQRGHMRLYEEKLKMLPIAYEMECRGITANKPTADRLYCQFQQASKEEGDTCVAIAAKYEYDLVLPKGSLNNSIRNFCFGEIEETGIGDGKILQRRTPHLDLPVVKTTDKGNPSLDKLAIEEYLVTLEPGSDPTKGISEPQRSDQYQFIKSLAAKRKRDTAISFIESYQLFWLPDGRAQVFLARTALHQARESGIKNPFICIPPTWFTLYPSLNLTGTDTLRCSSSNPNGQQISKKEDFNLREMFGPAPEREWWSLDAKNIELRIPAYKAPEPAWIELFEKPDEPPYYGSTHLLNFHTVYKDIWDDAVAKVGFDKAGPYCKETYESSWYRYCKNGGFAIQYGCQEAKADATFHRRGSYKLLKSRFAKLEALNQYWIKYADKHGYIETAPDASVDPLHGYPLLCTRTEYGRILPTVPLNYFVQGTACWWMMRAQIKVQTQLDQWNRNPKLKPNQGYYMVLQVHDELVFDFPRGIGPTPHTTNLSKIRLIQKLMESCGPDIGVQTPVSVEYHPVSWAKSIVIK